MAKKFKFTDLAYDEAKPVQSEQTVINKDVNINDLKIEKKEEKSEVKVEKQPEIINIPEETTKNVESLDVKKEVVETKPTRKINYEIDYSEYETDTKSETNVSNVTQEPTKVIEEQPHNIDVSPQNFQKNRTQLRTYSSVLQENTPEITPIYEQRDKENVNLSGTMSSSFSPNKIKDLISFKEKLDIKTNIYLKSSIVIKLKELENRTNESRSSIINKLLEYAIKNMEEN